MKKRKKFLEKAEIIIQECEEQIKVLEKIIIKNLDKEKSQTEKTIRKN